MGEGDVGGFGVGGVRLEPRHVTLLQLELGCVLDRDDPLIAWDVARHHVEERGLAAAGAAADENVRSRHHASLEKPKSALAAAPELYHPILVEPAADELADVQQRTFDRHLRNP